MSDRWERRKHDAEVAAIVKKAKQDMADWMLVNNIMPSEQEMKIWQAGYLYGLNRGVGNKDK